jgi:hypothetical protein
MRVDISQEIDADNPILEIPWIDPLNSQRRYVDIKASPETIADLWECREFPALGEFLRVVNSRQSVFRTAKCDVWETTDLADDERLDFGLPCKVGSYVDLLFDDPELNCRLETYRQSAESIAERVREVRVQAELEIIIRSCLFHPEERRGYYLTIFAHAYGKTPLEAAAHWEITLEALAKALEGISRDSAARREQPPECPPQWPST